MAKDFVIISDSAMDMPCDFIKDNNIDVIPMHFSINNQEYQSYSDYRDISQDEFYDKLKAGVKHDTAQISILQTVEAFEVYLKAGKDILMIVLASSLSGSHNSVSLAIRSLKNKYKEREVLLIDSKGASSGEGLLVYYANYYRSQGYTLNETFEKINELSTKMCQWFTTDDATILKNGGRYKGNEISTNIKPVFHLDHKGNVLLSYKKLNRKAAIRALINSYINNRDESYLQVIIPNCQCEEDAILIKNELLKFEPNLEIIIAKIGPIIGSHVGANTIGICYIGKK